MKHPDWKRNIYTKKNRILNSANAQNVRHLRAEYSVAVVLLSFTTWVFFFPIFLVQFEWLFSFFSNLMMFITIWKTNLNIKEKINKILWRKFSILNCQFSIKSRSLTFRIFFFQIDFWIHLKEPNRLQWKHWCDESEIKLK